MPLTLRGGTDISIRGSEEFSSQFSEIDPEYLKRQLPSFLDDRLPLINRVREAMALAQDKQQEYSDKKRRGNLNVVNVGDLHRFIGSFAGLARHGAAYIIDLPKSMATHPTLYVGRLNRYHDPLGPSPWTEGDQGEDTPP
ncbi:Pol protein [Phytophthora palmivora]|uniref:Pol protein n=1 Tax=Phytophthora palmivora TaxID=4796 RepID=A0A2P4XWC8_9STRA|nr:Pol protein [Phytophthora palmivora]